MSFLYMDFELKRSPIFFYETNLDLLFLIGANIFKNIKMSPIIYSSYDCSSEPDNDMEDEPDKINYHQFILPLSIWHQAYD